MRSSALLLLAGAGRRAPRIRTPITTRRRSRSIRCPIRWCCRTASPSKNAKTWNEKRRPELLNLFRTEMYGRRPGKPEHMTFELTAIDKQALGGKAVRKEVTVYFAGKKDGPKMDILIYLPAGATQARAAVSGAEFRTEPDGGERSRYQAARCLGARRLDEDAGEEGVGGGVARVGRQPLAGGEDPGRRLRAGGRSITATSSRISMAACNTACVPCSSRRVRTRARRLRPGAWGLSRALDYLETDKQVDARHVAVFGHSRLGKTSLWAGAEDTRFAMVISNCSGEGGAALSRREFGEQPRHLNQQLPALVRRQLQEVQRSRIRLAFRPA